MKPAALALAALAALCSAPARADDAKVESAVRMCGAMPSDADRLHCYDHVRDDLLGVKPSAETATTVPAPAPGIDMNDKGAWQTSSATNPVDDTKTVSAYLVADTGRSTFGDSVVFYARCKSNKTEAYIAWNDYLASDSGDVYNDWKNVTVRIGDQKATQEHWSTSTDQKATFAPDWAGDLLKRMMTADRFVAVVTPYNESPVTAVFNTHGMRAALTDLMATCKWSAT